MKSSTLLIGAYFVCTVQVAGALVINEVMSNPIGDDSGREWIELYNNSSSTVDLSAMTVSIKGGNPIVVTPLQGGNMLLPGEYAIIGSVVSGQTKFLTDYPTYTGALLKGALSLVNTGSTSLEIKINGVSATSIPAYVAAKEGATLSLVDGSYVPGSPTPGTGNSPLDTTPDTPSSSSSITTSSQVTVPQMSPPSPDITIYLSEEKIVVAGASSNYAVFSTTRAGKEINGLRYSWAFGDGGQGVGSSTMYTYAYPGRYVAQVEALNASVFGTARMIVRVVRPDLEIMSLGSGKYGAYIDVRNPSDYPLDLSQWGFSLDGAYFPFPKNTMILAHETTRFSGIAMGFASTTLTASTSVKILFPTLEEAVRFIPKDQNLVLIPETATETPKLVVRPLVPVSRKVALRKPQVVLGTSTMQDSVKKQPELTFAASSSSKDTRIVSWLKGLFGR